ncbi:MAG: PAS domain S-box protein, partial [Pseudomonadota bacterium]
KDGSEFPVEIVASHVHFEGREFNCGFARDITERKQLERKKAELAAIVESSFDAIIGKSLTGIITSWNPGAEKIFGYSAAEAIGQPMLLVIPPEQQHEEAAILTRIAQGETIEHYETERICKDGRRIPISATISPLRDGQGQVVGASKIARDVTESRRAREMLEKFNSELEQRVALRTSELAARNREIEALLDSIPDTVLLCDQNGAVISSHSPTDQPGLIHAYGGPPNNGRDSVLQEIAHEMHALMHTTDQTVVQEFDRPLHAAAISIEARATRAGPDRLLILLRDISARKRIERDILANLERERLLSVMKSQFITVASHEFRTPLAAAMGSLELLERHAGRMTEVKRVELLARAQRSLDRLTTIMDDVHQLSRADSGLVMVKRMAVDLVQIVQDLIREVEAGDRHSHAFSFQPSGKGDAVPVDTNLFNHILSNLLGNAVRYSPAGTRISVTLDIGAQSFSLTVADEGIGIPEAERERVFEPFARGSNVGQINGTGLGLNIVKRYAELMGGRIELLPTARGAAFRVELPFI